jgi:polyisoprenoid-binding protein YceI
MRSFILSFRWALGIGLGVAALPVAAGAAVEKYKIDPVHTSVVFKINHLGFSHTYGHFPGAEGTFQLDEQKPENTAIDIKIKTESLTTFDAKRDKHLKSPDFFNVKQNPLIAFKSKSVKKTGDTYQITGDLTLNGVAKPVTVDFKRLRTGKDPMGATRTGGDTSLKIKRSDYKMGFMQGENMVGDDVELLISVEGIRE